MIFHQPDDELLGFVDYLPLSDSITTGIPSRFRPLEVAIWPNPADTYLCIELPAGLETEEGYVVVIYTIEGKKVASHIMEDNPVRLDISSLPEGTFTVKVSNGKSSVSSLFIRQ